MHLLYFVWEDQSKKGMKLKVCFMKNKAWAVHASISIAARLNHA